MPSTSVHTGNDSELYVGHMPLQPVSDRLASVFTVTHGNESFRLLKIQKFCHLLTLMLFQTCMSFSSVEYKGRYFEEQLKTKHP